MSIARSLAVNTVIQILGKALSTLTGVVLISLMTRSLGAAGFGAYSTANAYLQIFALLMDLGINVTFPAMLGEHADDEAFQKRALSAILTLRVLVSAGVLVIIAPALAFAWPFPWEVKLAIVALALSFVFPSLGQTLIGVQQQRLRMGVSSIAENVGRLVTIAGLVLSPLFGWGLVAQCWIISIASFFVFAINAWSTRRFLPLAWNWDPAFWSMAIKRSWPVGLSIALNLIYYKSDALILQYFRPQTEVGIYGAAYRMLEVLISIPFLYAGVLLPVLSKAWADQRRDDMRILISRSLEVMILLILPLIVGMQWYGERTLIFISGPEFAPSGLIARILVFGIAAIYLNTVLSHAIVAFRAQMRMLPAYAVVAVITFAGYMIFIPKGGAIAAAWLTVASEVGILLASTLTVLGFVRFLPSPRLVAGAIASAGCMWFVGRWTVSFPLLVSILMCGMSYVVALALTGTVTPSTVRALFSVKQPESTPAKSH